MSSLPSGKAAPHFVGFGVLVFCFFFPGFADSTTWNNKTDGNSDFIGQEQCVKVNSKEKTAWQGSEITHGMMFKGGLQGERKEELPKSLVLGEWST